MTKQDDFPLGWEPYVSPPAEGDAKLTKLLVETKRDVLSSGAGEDLGFGAASACARGLDNGRPVDRSPPKWRVSSRE
jgi:hypothetical protein